MSQQQTNVHIDFDDLDEDIEKMEPSASETTEPSSVLSPEIQAMLKHNHEQALNYIDIRFTKMNDELKTYGEKIESNTSRIDTLEKTVAKQNEFIRKAVGATGGVVPPEFDPTQQAGESADNKGIIDTTLGTVGNVAHGLVDTAAFLCESVIDLVTLGKARRVR